MSTKEFQMSVVFKASERSFKASDFLFANKELVNAIVEQALISQTEAFVDMIVDGQADMSRDGINTTLRGVKESTEQFLGDMLGDLEIMIIERLREVNYGAAVTGLKFSIAGDVTDVEVNVSVGTD